MLQVQRAVLAFLINLVLLSAVFARNQLSDADHAGRGLDSIEAPRNAHARNLKQHSVYLNATISQRYPLISACNFITVTVRASADVDAGDTFTISGLTGTQTSDDQALPVNSTMEGTFEPYGVWTQDTGTMVVTVATDFSAGEDQSFFFEVKNPESESGAVETFISSESLGTNEFRIDTMGTTRLNVPEGSDPFVTETPEFLEVTMRQSNPLAGASNVLDFTVRLNTFLPDMSRLQIFNVDCIEPLEIDNSTVWEICPLVTTSSTTTTAAPTTSSSTTTTTAAPTSSSTTTLAPTTTSSTTTSTPAPTTSSTTSLPPTTTSSTTTATSSTTTTPMATSSSSTTTTPAPTSSSSTTAAPTSSSSSTTAAPTSSSSTTSMAPTSSSTTSMAPTSSSTTTSVAPTSSSSTTSVAPTTSSTTPGTSSSTTPGTSSSTTIGNTTTATTSTTTPASTSTTTPASTSTTTAAPTSSSSTTTPAPTSSSSTTTAAPTSSSSTTTAAPTSSSSTTTAAPTSSSSTTTAAPTSSSSTTTAAPTSSSSTTTAAPTSSSSTTTAAPTSSSSSTTAAPTSSSSTTTAAPTSSSSTTTPMATSSSSTTTTLAPTTSSSTTTTTPTPTSSSSSTTAAPTSSSSSTTAAPTSSSSTTSVAPTSSSSTTSVAPTTSSTTPGTSSSTTPGTSSSTTIGNTTTATTSTTTPASTSTTTPASTSTTTAAPTSSSSTTTPAPTSSSSTTTAAPTSSSSTTTAAPTSSSSSSSTTAAPTSSSSTTTVAPTSSSSTTSLAPSTSSSTTTSAAPTSSSSTTVTSSTTTTLPPTSSSSTTVTSSTTTVTSSTTTTLPPTTSSSTTSTTPVPTTSSSSTTTTAAPTTSSSTTTMAPTTSTPVWTTPTPEFPCCPIGFTPIVVHTFPPYALWHGAFYSEEQRRFLFYNAHELDTSWWLGPLTGTINVRNRNTQQCLNQEAPALSITGNADTDDDGEHAADDGVCSIPIARFPIATPNTRALGVVGGANPMRIVQAAFTAFEVRQGNPYFDNGNPQVDFVFATNSDAAPGSVFRVGGLTSLESSIPNITVTSTLDRFEPFARWSAADSSIEFVVQSTLPIGSQHVVAVTSFMRKDAPAIARSYGSATVSGVIEAGEYDAVVRGQSRTVTVDLERATAPNNLAVSQDAFGTITMTWTVPDNTGPSNNPGELTGYLLIAREDGVQIARESASWALSGQFMNGSDAVTTDGDFLMTSGRSLVLSVAARNGVGAGAAATRNAVVGRLPCDNACGDGRRINTEACDDGNDMAGDGCSSTCAVEAGYVCWADRALFECATARSASSGTSTCAIPEFVGVSVFETTDLQGLDNEITIAFRASMPIPANKVVTFTGLRGSGTTLTTLDIDSQGSPLMDTASWIRTSGTVSVVTTATLEANTTYSFAVTLVNPTATQAAVAVTVSCNGCASSTDIAVASAVSQQTVLGVTVIAPTCAAPFFGADCSETCEGIVKGSQCVCPPGRFGHTCRQTATVSVANSVTPTRVQRGQSRSLKSATGAGVDIPTGALGTDAVVSATGYDILVEMAADQTDLEPMSIVMDCKPDLSFLSQVELAIPVDLTQVAAEQSRGRRVQMAFFNTTRSRWQVQGGYIDRVTGHCKAFSNHFSLWTTMSVVPPPEVPIVETTPPPVVEEPGGPAATTTTTTPEPDGDDGTWGLGLSDAEFAAAVVGFSVLALLVLCGLCAACYFVCRTPTPEPQRQPLIMESRPPQQSNAVLVEVAPGMEHWITPQQLPYTAQAYPNLTFQDNSPQRGSSRPYSIPTPVMSEPQSQLFRPQSPELIYPERGPRMSAPPMPDPMFGSFQPPPPPPRRPSQEGSYMTDYMADQMGTAYMSGGYSGGPPVQPMPMQMGSAEPMMPPGSRGPMMPPPGMYPSAGPRYPA